MKLYPEFTENGDSSVIMYFNAENKKPELLCDELEKIYACYSKMSVIKRDARVYVAVEVDFEKTMDF